MTVKRAMSALAAGICVMALLAPVQAQTREYRIAAGNLKAALDGWARQSGRQVIYKVDEVRHADSAGVLGNRSSDAALNAILSGTGFSAREDSSGAVAIVRVVPSGEADAGSAAAESESAEIVVTGSRIRGAAPTGLAPEKWRVPLI